MNTAELINEYLTRANVDSIDKLNDGSIVVLYDVLNEYSDALLAYDERLKRSKKDAHDLAMALLDCIRKNTQLNFFFDMQEGVLDDNVKISPYRYVYRT